VRRCFCVLVLLVLGSSPLAAENLLLPAFAHNARGLDGTRWSSEIYLTNPGDQPVQVTIVELLPGMIDRPAPCDLFMPPTRVVPPHSAVVWNSAGLAVDLGCAQHAVGALVLNADARVSVTTRMVSYPADSEHAEGGILKGHGQEFDAIPISDLPPPGDYLLSALVWHPKPCGKASFDTFVGFANPGPEAVSVVIDIAHDQAPAGIIIDNKTVDLPAYLEVPPMSWRQVSLQPIASAGESCLCPESFDLRITTEGAIAFYASVIDRQFSDPRTVLPVPLEASR
jgi:hypothetical protein